MADNLNSDTILPPGDLGRRTAPSPQKIPKPLNAKAYGSIGHLPRSRIGTGDWHVNEGMARILCEKPRKGDRIVVREKLDGACMSVANVAGVIHALGRAGYPALSAPHEHLRLFDDYVRRRHEGFTALLEPGERIVGEWLTVAHGTVYDPYHPGFAPFIAFDIFRGTDRVCTDEFSQRCAAAEILTAKTIHDAEEALSIEDALGLLGPLGHHGATEPVEGAVWRVEREGKVEFLAKYVRPDKIDGKYLPGTDGNVTDGKSICLWRE
ncbi:hypothetical protein ACVIGB_000780 [Bradyrhizobium sp. USDA 4341]